LEGAVLASFDGVSKSYGERRALADLTLAVRAGEVFGLLGPIGAGKTTALRLLCGLLAPDAGRVTIAGEDVQRQPLAARRNLGYVPDGAPLYANLTPDEHLRLVGALHGLEPAASAAEADRLLTGFELAGRRGDPVGGFSRGMRQKLAIACALLPKPALLVLDEPLNGLDTTSALVIKALVRSWADRGGAVVVTSHLLEVVERVCDRMAILADGRLLAVGTFAELRTRAGGGSTLEEVFRSLTHSEDPAEVAGRILGTR
jgi:ABC-2 type transport system ATP-binding protein